MKTQQEIEERIETALQRARGYAAGASQQTKEYMYEYWIQQASIQSEIAHALKWVLEGES